MHPISGIETRGKCGVLRAIDVIKKWGDHKNTPAVHVRPTAVDSGKYHTHLL